MRPFTAEYEKLADFPNREHPGLGLIMYILTTLEFPKHNHDFHLLTTSVNAKYYY